MVIPVYMQTCSCIREFRNHSKIPGVKSVGKFIVYMHEVP